MMNTSLSGSENLTASSQATPRSSAQCAPFHFTMRPVPGAGTPWWLVSGGGAPGAPGALTSRPGMVVVWLPVWKPAAYTREPSGVAASARGVSVKSEMTVTGVPPSPAPR